MKGLIVLVVLTACVLAIHASESPSRVHLEERFAKTFDNRLWHKTNMKVNPRELKKIFFALTQQNTQELEDLFWKVTDPQNKEHYGKYLTVDDLTARIAPSELTQKMVEKWLITSGVPAASLKWAINRDFIEVDLPISKVESLFRVSFSSYRHIPSGRVFSASMGPYTVPAFLEPHLDFVAGIVGLPNLESRVRVNKEKNHEAAGDKAITPDVIRARYNVTTGLINSNEKNTNAVAEFQHQNYDPSDLVEFFTRFVTVGQEFDNITNVVGVNKPKEPQLEASLDTQFLMGVTPNASTWFIIVAPDAFWADLVHWVYILGNTTDVPLVHSISYGAQGDYPSQSYRERLDTEFQKLGLRGISIIIASGDSGAGCLYRGGSPGFEDLPPCYFAASYPATSSYVTSVGATEFITGNTGPEAAVSQFKSGGGWDISFPRPSYQDDAVKTYLATASKLPSYGYNSSNRATPDVAALGSEYFQVINHGALEPVGGTSASTPTFSAIVTLLNQIRLDKGDAPLGFLNQWIYQTWAAHPDAFFDVVEGNNLLVCCQSQPSGFETAVGWDPVTGVGTPNFAVLSTLV